MEEKTYKKQIIFDDTHLEAIEEIQKNIPRINTLSEAVRYAVINMANQTDEKLSQEEKIDRLQKKINAMAKDMSILINMVAGGFEGVGIKSIKDKSETDIYNSAKEEADREIQKAVTKKSNKYIPTKERSTLAPNIEKNPVKKPTTTGSNFFV